MKRKIKSILSVMLAVAMIVSLAPSTANAEEPEVIEIGTVAELQKFSKDVTNGETFAGKIVKLTADIDLAGEEWEPIGGDTVYFAGEFDGNGKTISNLTQTKGARMGLFGLVEKSYIHDLTLEDVNFTVDAGSARVGAIAGNLQYWNVVEDVTIDGINITLNGNDGLVGTVTGYAWKSQLGNVDVKDAVFTVNGTGNVIGGHTGYGRAHVWDTNVTGNNEHWLEGTVQTIDGTEYVLQNYFVDCDVDGITMELNGTGTEAGGFLGSDTYNSHSNYFVDCHVTGLDVTCAEETSQTVGGFIAWNNGTTSAGTVKGFDGCSASGKITGTEGVYGGFVGQVGGRAHEYYNASADVDIISGGTAGGFAGVTQAYSTHKYTFNDCTATGDVSGNVAGGFTGKNGLSGDGKSVFVDYTGCVANGKVNGTKYAGGMIGEVNPELPATNWNIVDSTGALTLTENTAATDVTGPDGKTGALIGYFDGVANGDAKEGNKIVLTLSLNTPETGVNKSDDTTEENIVVVSGETVRLVIYRNGNTKEAYKTVSLPKALKGSTLDLTDININEYYSSANGFKMDGYFNDGGWTAYKAGKNPAELDEITVNGWTNIICMVTDYEKVVVKAVVNGDKDNAENLCTELALKGTNLVEFLSTLEVEEREGYELDKWFNWDWYGHKIADDATVNGWTNVYVTYTDVTAPTFRFENTSGEPLAARTVKLIASEPIQAPKDWTPVEGSDGKEWTMTFIENKKIKNFTVTDLAGNVSEPQTLDVKNVDSSEPAGAVTYSTVDPTNGDVTVTLKTNTDCETPDGWTKVNWREFTKVYTANGNESFTLTSRTGVDATEPVIVNVNNIDKEAPTFILDNTSGDPAQSRTVTLKASEAILSPDEGWEPVEGSDGKEWTKTFEENTKVEGFTVTDLVGNVSEAQTLEVTDIDTKAPVAEVSYSTTEKTTGTVTVTIVTDEAVTLDGEGWIAAADATGNQFQKVYEANGEETVVLTDAAGNYAVAEVSVQNIVAPEEPKAPEAPSDNDVEDEEVENEDAEVEESGEDRAPETGDSANIMGYVFVMVAALGVAIMAIIKKRNA